MQITNLQVYPVREPKGKLRAYARVVVDDQLQLTGLRVYEGTNGLFISYPCDPSVKGEDYRQLYYPLIRELRDHIEQAVLAEYQAAVTPEPVKTLDLGELNLLALAEVRRAISQLEVCIDIHDESEEDFKFEWKLWKDTEPIREHTDTGLVGVVVTVDTLRRLGNYAESEQLPFENVDKILKNH